MESLEKNNSNVEQDENYSSKRIKIDENNLESIETSTNCVKLNPDETSQSSVATTTQTLSKRQLKKLRKMQQWEERKKEKRLKEREKLKQRKIEQLMKGEPQGPSRKQLKRNKSEMSSNFLQVAVDLDFDDMMTDRDIGKCVKQLLRIYTINRRSIHPAKLHFCGIKENGNVHKVLEKNDGYQNWDVKWYFQSFANTFDLNKNQLVYLSSDADEELSELEKDIIYVIGGLVDHNHHKGYCLNKAKKLGIKTARLPLNKYIDMKTRTVLSTYHVFEILLRISEGKNWTEAILEVLPMRKGAKQKDNVQSEALLENNDER